MLINYHRCFRAGIQTAEHMSRSHILNLIYDRNQFSESFCVNCMVENFLISQKFRLFDGNLWPILLETPWPLDLPSCSAADQDSHRISIIPTWVFPKIGVGPPNHPFLIGFSLINHPFWGTTIFGNTYIYFPFWIAFSCQPSGDFP